MTIDEKAGKTLEELGVRDASSVATLFAEVRTAMEAERQELVSRSQIGGPERAASAKALRDRWLGRKKGLLASIDQNWLKPAPQEFKPYVGREFNQLRQAAASLEVAKLIEAIPLMDLSFMHSASQPFSSPSTPTSCRSM